MNGNKGTDCVSNRCLNQPDNIVCCKPKAVAGSSGSSDSAADGEGCSGNTCTLSNPLGDTTNIPTLLGKIINAALGIIGSLALVMFIYGGVLWMLSAGKADQVTKGKDTLIWATIGIIIIFSAYALVKLVLTSMGVN